MKKLQTFRGPLAAIGIFLTILFLPLAMGYSSSETYANRVTISVPPSLFIHGDQKDISLSFSDARSGAESNMQSVTYTVRSNNMTQSEGAAAVTARLDGDFPNMELKVQVGPYTKEGGNAELRAISSGYVAITDTETPLAAKANAVGDGKLLRGQIAMSYKAVATDNLSSGEYSRELTITLTDV